jgi:hypothetical protein
MSSKFWTVVSAVNAPLFTMLALVLLLVALVWRISLPYPETLKSGESKPGADAKESSIDKNSHELPEPKNTAFELERNPFSSKYLERAIAEKKAARLAAEQARKEPVKPDVVQVDVQQETPKTAVPDKSLEIIKVAEPALPAVMEFVYKGMMTSLDGTSLALVENCVDKICSYHKVGTVFDGVKIEYFDRKSLSVSIDGEVCTLKRGVVTELRKAGGNGQ